MAGLPIEKSVLDLLCMNERMCSKSDGPSSIPSGSNPAALCELILDWFPGPASVTTPLFVCAAFRDVDPDRKETKGEDYLAPSTPHKGNDIIGTVWISKLK